MHQGKEFQRDAVPGIKLLKRLFVLHLSKARVYGLKQAEILVSHSITLIGGTRSETLVAHLP